MAGLMQAIEFRTSRIEEVEALVRARRGESDGTVIRGTITARLNQPGTYLTIIESHSSDAIASQRQSAVAASLVADLAGLCDGPPTIYTFQVGPVPHPRTPPSD